MADAFKSLGSEEVTLVVRDDRILGNTEAFAGEAVRASFERRGIEVLLGTATERVTRAANGARSPGITADIEGGNPRTLTGDEILGGHRPCAAHSDEIGLDSVGLRPGIMAHRR